MDMGTAPGREDSSMGDNFNMYNSGEEGEEERAGTFSNFALFPSSNNQNGGEQENNRSTEMDCKLMDDAVNQVSKGSDETLIKLIKLTIDFGQDMMTTAALIPPEICSAIIHKTSENQPATFTLSQQTLLNMPSEEIKKKYQAAIEHLNEWIRRKKDKERSGSGDNEEESNNSSQ